ncbi:hypothetical protein DPMN_170741 [Dreissena polymorpha]|uniref:Uncharacterized protein n=1 Tax=Dreissena polymorpha TaxID=45954 RepID=A0A9D4IEV3_DREPO|nr:hypothetical protein DPMN_170741 [Dreissena polymorpha]
MLSWASYLFGSSATAEEQNIEQTVAMETETPSNDKDWVVVDHAGHDEMPKVGITDLENLLIEHPSMSVYNARAVQERRVTVLTSLPVKSLL